MQGVSAATPRRVNDRVDVEVRWDRHRIVEESSRERRVITLGMPQNRVNAHLATRARNSHSDLATIGNDQFLDTHGAFSFFRNAFMPDCPSSETRRVAIASIVYGMESMTS